MAISNVTLGTSETTIYTATGNTAITCMYLCNYSGVAVTFDIHAKPAGEALANENKIYDTVNIPANDTFLIDTEKMILANTDVITGLASAATSVSVTISTIGI